MLAVETFDLTKDYLVGFWRKRPRRALDHLNLRVEAGEVFGLLGPNGAGKTTTLKLLFRLVFPTSGTARILGKELDDISMHARIGYLPENPYFYDHLTAEEFLNYAGELFGIPAAQRRQRVGRLLERVGLVDSRDVPLRKFSKGMVQRLGIAQALINDPEVIFLDEPMSGLDPLGRREVRDLILQLRGEGKTVFFSTHILSDAEALCDQVAILVRGKLQGCGDLRQILRMGVATTEIVLEHPPPDLLAELQPYHCSAIKTGEAVRVEVPVESDVATVLGIVLRKGAKIISLNPVRTSLEDYFLAQVGANAEAARAEEKEAPARMGEGKR
jgi:ABC-2 type transport system ATP-binding protein